MLKTNDATQRGRNWVIQLDHEAFRRLSAAQIMFFDRVVVPVGRSADSSRLWLVIAGLLAAFGGRRGRRAALRGVMSVGATSAIVNQGVKRIARRKRPVGTFIRTRHGRAPTTSSFPSGHAASAAAFATGVSQEIPLLGAPMSVLAAGVGISRVYAGVHYPADVIVGAAAGAALSTLTRKLWPVASREPAEVRPVYTRIDTLVSEDGDGLTFVVNASAGSALAQPPQEEIQEALPKAKVLVVDEPEDWDAAYEKAAGAKALGIAGGDGSINSAAQVAMENKQPLAIVPAGTLNHLARDLGIESVEETVEAIKNGRAAAIDVATIDGRVFLNTASFGSYVELVDAREKLESKIGKWPAVLVALFNVLRSSEPIDVEIDGKRRSLWMIFIGNCRYHPEGFAPSWRERLDDGLLDVRMVDGTHPYARTRLLLAVLSGTLGTCRVYEQSLVKQMKVRSVDGSAMRLARDGETFEGSAEFTVSKLDQPLPIYMKPE